MIDTPFKDAMWLWIVQEQRDERDRRVRMRKIFALDRVPEKFEALISADAKYTLFVNGEFVHHGPARNTHPVWSFDRIDLAPFLRTGKNLIAVLGYQFGVSNYTYSYAGASGVIFRAPGIKSDNSWKLSLPPKGLPGNWDILLYKHILQTIIRLIPRLTMKRVCWQHYARLKLAVI